MAKKQERTGKDTMIGFGGVLKPMTPDEQLRFVQLLIDLYDRQQVASTENEDECAICAPSNIAYWQQNYPSNWQAMHDTYCAELGCE